jgi:hypothetical protein
MAPMPYGIDVTEWLLVRQTKWKPKVNSLPITPEQKLSRLQ